MPSTLETMIANLATGVSDVVRLAAHACVFRSGAIRTDYQPGARVFIIDWYDLGTVQAVLPSGKVRVSVKWPDEGPVALDYEPRHLRDADFTR
jgi:hypothetical protein